MRTLGKIAMAGIIIGLSISCDQKNNDSTHNPDSIQVTAKDILGNPDYLAISYGGYRLKTRDAQPSIPQLMDDIKIIHAMGIRILRTYNVQLAHASNVMEAIRQLKEGNPEFEMYVMLGAWIDCKNAWTEMAPDHNQESEHNASEIARAVDLANKYPDIIKVLAVGNEAMVKWAESYYVQPAVILKWVKHLQNLKKSGDLPGKLWITSSDDFSSWGGGDPLYHTEDLEELIREVDYISMHTYAYHNSHYNPGFWIVPEGEQQLSDIEKADAAMLRARDFAVQQYKAVSDYVKSLGIDKPIHIGETGWATVSNGHYGVNGSRATDEYKQGLYYKHIREWTNREGISCFYFEAFDEQWKDSHNPKGSENHFGLFTLDGKAKFPVWDLVDKRIFENLKRDGNVIEKTYGGDKETLLKEVLAPPVEYGDVGLPIR